MSQNDLFKPYDCPALFVKCDKLVTPLDSGWEEADQKSAESVQAEGMVVQFLQTKVWWAILQTSVRSTSRQHFICCGPHSVFSFKVMAIDLFLLSYLQNIDDWWGRGRFWLPLKAFFPSQWCSFPRDDRSFYKPGFTNPKYHHFNPRASFHRRDHFHPKLHHIALREKEREKEKERYEQRESADGSSPPKQNNGESVKATIIHTMIIHTPLHLIRTFMKRSGASRPNGLDYAPSFQLNGTLMLHKKYCNTENKPVEAVKHKDAVSLWSCAQARLSHF